MRHLFVTGAGRGIGFDTAIALANTGNRVTATSRSESGLKKLRSRNPELIDIIPADLSRPDDISLIADHLSERSEFLDGIVHNAGLLINKPFAGLSDVDWHAMLEVNLLVPVRLTRTLLPHLNIKSHILHIGSMGGYQNSEKYRGLSGYSSTKGALAILAETLAVELKPQQISSNCLCLGAVDTEMFLEAFSGFEAPVSSTEMGIYIAEFLLNGHKLFNGKILPVALSNPE